MAATKFLYLEALDHRRSNSPNDEDTDKFDIWNTNNDNTTHHHINNPISKTTVTSRKVPYKQPHRCNQKTLLPNTKRSLPINIPELSKIMIRDPYNKVRSSYGDHAVDDDDDNESDDDWLPPHEYLARIRSASLSMHEGVGRTLKGRDLSCLRNAIWKQTGFGQD